MKKDDAQADEKQTWDRLESQGFNPKIHLRMPSVGECGFISGNI